MTDPVTPDLIWPFVAQVGPPPAAGAYLLGRRHRAELFHRIDASEGSMLRHGHKKNDFHLGNRQTSLKLIPLLF